MNFSPTQPPEKKKKALDDPVNLFLLFTPHGTSFPNCCNDAPVVSPIAESSPFFNVRIHILWRNREERGMMAAPIMETTVQVGDVDISSRHQQPSLQWWWPGSESLALPWGSVATVIGDLVESMAAGGNQFSRISCPGEQYWEAISRITYIACRRSLLLRPPILTKKSRFDQHILSNTNLEKKKKTLIQSPTAL